MDKEATEKKKIRKRWKNRDGKKMHSTVSSTKLAERKIFNLREMTKIPGLMKKYDIYTLTEQRRIGHLNPMVKQLMSHEDKLWN